MPATVRDAVHHRAERSANRAVRGIGKPSIAGRPTTSRQARPNERALTSDWQQENILG
jgi:hypothetical protein